MEHKAVSGFGVQLGEHSAWRREVARHLRELSDWMREHELLDDETEDRVRNLQDKLRTDKVMVAFVAEFSRGKSELINAVFFASYGRRIMPASAGRTTMCPTELGYDPAVPPCLRLLPIETRLQPQALLEWRQVPEKWVRVDLDVNDPHQLAGAMEKVSETRHVTVETARALGFWHDDAPEDNPPMDEQGRVEVPRWRHALINMAHPLLKQGLVVLDTPGLNAIGAEPELTVSLIPQAQAAVFILAADTGVTKSDLTVWREHISAMDGGDGAKFVVLNKVDTLWDDMNSPAQIQAQIDRQCAQTAQTLELSGDQVIALSAQKGLLAKVRGDRALLARSGVPVFERVLAHQVLGARQQMLVDTLQTMTHRMRDGAQRVFTMRRRELSEQELELKSLRGKNQNVIRQMRVRIVAEKAEFDRSGASVLAVRSVHLKLLRELVSLLGASSINRELRELTDALREPGLKIGLGKIYARGFANLHRVVERVRTLEGEIESMLRGSFRQINVNYGFTLQVTPPPDMKRLTADLHAIERSHVRYLGVGNMVKLARPEFTEKLVRALLARVRSIFEAALGEVELWNKSSSSQLDAQLRERRHAFTRRVDAILRIQNAAGGLDSRIAELREQSEQIAAQQVRMERLMAGLHRFAQQAPVSAAAFASTSGPAPLHASADKAQAVAA